MADQRPRATRRKVLRSGAAGLIGSSLLAGCTGGGGTDPTTEGPATDTDSPTESSPTASPTPVDESYSVSMVPVGEVEFESVPETWVANNGSWADMGIALGLEPPKGVWLTPRYHTQYYDSIPNVSVDKSDMVSLWQDGLSKEIFYELNGDVHIMDPNFLIYRFKGWERDDVEEIHNNIGPEFGNCIYAQH